MSPSVSPLSRLMLLRWSPFHWPSASNVVRKPLPCISRASTPGTTAPFLGRGTGRFAETSWVGPRVAGIFEGAHLGFGEELPIS